MGWISVRGDFSLKEKHLTLLIIRMSTSKFFIIIVITCIKMYHNVSRCIKMIVILPMHVTCTCTACNNHERVCTVCAQMSVTPASRCHIHLHAGVIYTCKQVYITPARRCRVHLRAGVIDICAQVLPSQICIL